MNAASSTETNWEEESGAQHRERARGARSAMEEERLRRLALTPDVQVNVV
jgi:hypothetical protein